MEYYTTTEIALFGIQSSMIHCSLYDNINVKVLLNTGKTLMFECENKEQSSEILQILKYYPPNNRENNSVELEFKFRLYII